MYLLNRNIFFYNKQTNSRPILALLSLREFSRHSVTGRPCGSMAQWSECSRGMREVLGSSPGWAVCFFLPCDIYSSVPAWFRADSGTNLIKQGEVVTGRPCGSVAQWSECSRGMREVLGSSPGSGRVLFPPLWQ